MPAGTVQRHRTASRLLGDTREVYVYRPAPARRPASGRRRAERAAALLVLFDAHAYLSAVPTPVILDNWSTTDCCRPCQR